MENQNRLVLKPKMGRTQNTKPSINSSDDYIIIFNLCLVFGLLKKL